MASAFDVPPLPVEFYARETTQVARDLLGCWLVHETPAGLCAGIIVETEAYGPEDRANHAYRGQTKRNAVMFGRPGLAYVYRIYGVHWCLNAVTVAEGVGEAVLIRAIEPRAGPDLMRARRGQNDVRRLCAGPACLCQAMEIEGQHNGADLTQGPLRILPRTTPEPEIVATPRIGVKHAADRLWRFAVVDSAYVSRRP